MDKNSAFKLFETYIVGWKHNDLNTIIEPLHDEIVIIESHGPKYIGLYNIKLWFNLWKQANSYIKKWDIVSSNYCENSQTLFCEWDFECVSFNKVYALLGISVVQFKGYKVSFLHEYRMTSIGYIWNGLELNSD